MDFLPATVIITNILSLLCKTFLKVVLFLVAAQGIDNTTYPFADILGLLAPYPGIPAQCAQLTSVCGRHRCFASPDLRVDDAAEEVLLVLALERRVARHHLVQQHPARPPVHSWHASSQKYYFGHKLKVSQEKSFTRAVRLIVDYFWGNVLRSSTECPGAVPGLHPDLARYNCT